MNFWKKWFRKKSNYVLVKTLEIPVTSTSNMYGDEEKGTLYIYLYENIKGERKEERHITIRNCNDDPKRISDYWQVVYPWLQGQNFDDIPTYWDKVQDNNKVYIKSMYRRLLNK